MEDALVCEHCGFTIKGKTMDKYTGRNLLTVKCPKCGKRGFDFIRSNKRKKELSVQINKASKTAKVYLESEKKE